MEKLIAIVDVNSRTVGLATNERKAHQLRHAIETGQPIQTPVEAQIFLASVMQQAATANPPDHATFTDCLYQLRELFKEGQTNSDKDSRGKA